MGVLRLRQEEFAQARSYLERATRQGSPARWKQALDSATYWTLIEQARAARDAGDLGNARQLLDQAVRLDAREVTAENDLADVLAEAQRGDVILSPEISRLGESALQVLDFMAEAVAKGVAVHITKQKIVLDGSLQAEIMATVLGLAARIERDWPGVVVSAFIVSPVSTLSCAQPRAL